MAGWNLEASYAGLPSLFLTRQAAALPVPDPQVAVLNRPLAQALGLDPDHLTSAEAAGWLSGISPPPGAQPLAMAYAGHQFGNFTMLGDGRALLLGEQRAPDGRLWDVHLKGSGRTRYSRGGDGRAALGPMLREYLISEAMAGLGIPTTRTLAVLTTGERVLREGHPPGALMVRIAASHLRVGTFEYAAALEQRHLLDALVQFTIARHGPMGGSATDLLASVIERQAQLLAHWMVAGFVHGVMNTDNMALSGETIDYGPCAFLDRYDPAQVFSSIDRQGRYAYRNQPAIAQWNLARLAEALLPLLAEDEPAAIAVAQEALSVFPARYAAHRLALLRRRLGLAQDHGDDERLIDDLHTLMQESSWDYHLTWIDIRTLAHGGNAVHAQGAAWDAWVQRWQARQPDPALSAASVPLVIPRNHRVEEALAGAVAGDWAPWTRLLAAVSTPYTAPDPALMQPPDPQAAACYRTFCGT